MDCLSAVDSLSGTYDAVVDKLKTKNAPGIFPGALLCGIKYRLYRNSDSLLYVDFDTVEVWIAPDGSRSSWMLMVSIVRALADIEK